MVAISTVFSNAHKYLKTEEMRKEFEAFKKEYNVDCFEQAQALINMAISGKINNPQLLKNLKEYYNDEDPAFKNIVDKCLDHLVTVYGKEDIQLKDGRVVNGVKYLLNAKKSLSEQKTKTDENTL